MYVGPSQSVVSEYLRIGNNLINNFNLVYLVPITYNVEHQIKNERREDRENRVELMKREERSKSEIQGKSRRFQKYLHKRMIENGNEDLRKEE